MKRLVVLVLCALAGTVYAQPVPPSGLRKVTHDTTMTGAGTLASALGLAPCGSAGQTWVWNGSAFACGSSGGTGTVTNVSTLAPLQGGPITTTGTVSLINCSPNLIYKENAGGTAFACAADNDTTYTASTGITLGGTTFSLSTIATSRILGNTSGSTAAPTAQTGTQVTAMLDAFTTSLKGLAPASGGGTTNFLRADGTWAAPPGTGITGTITTGDLIAATGTSTVGNFAGSTPAACAAGQVLTRVTSAATGVITLTCTAIGTAGGTTGTGTANTLAMWTGPTALGNSPLAYNGTDTLTGPRVYAVSSSTANPTLQVSQGGATPSNWFLYSAIGSQTLVLGNDNTATTALSATYAGDVTMPHSLTLGGTLDLGTHQIHNVVDPSSAQDAATQAYVLAHTGITGTLTSGTIPVATGAGTVANSSATDDLTTFKINSTKFQVTEANGNTVIGGTVSATGAVTSTAFVQGNTGVYSGANSQVYLTKGTGKEGFGCFYATNALATCKINPVGYAEGQTQFRDLDIEDGEGNSVAYYTGSTKGVEFKGAVTADTTLAVTGNAALNGAQVALGNGTGATATHVVDTDGSSRPTISGCGTAPTVVGDDNSGYFITGSSNSGTCTLTFKTAFSKASCIVISKVGSAAGAVPAYNALPITTNLAITVATGGPVTTGIWQCTEH